MISMYAPAKLDMFADVYLGHGPEEAPIHIGYVEVDNNRVLFVPSKELKLGRLELEDIAAQMRNIELSLFSNQE